MKACMHTVSEPRNVSRPFIGLIVTSLLGLLVGSVPARAALTFQQGDLIEPQLAERAVGNLIRDGEMETLPEHWRIRGWTLDRNQPYQGEAAIKTGPGKGVAARVDIPVDLQVGETYTLSAWMKSDSLTRIGSADASVGVKIIDAKWHWSTQIVPDAPTTTWKRYAVTFTAPPSEHAANQRFTVVLFSPKGETGMLWVDNLQLVPGDQPRPFTTRSVPDLKRTVSRLNEAYATLRGIWQAQQRLAPETAALEQLREQAEALYAQLQAAAETTRAFNDIADQAWQTTVTSTETLTDTLRALAWHSWWTNPWARFNDNQAPDRLGTAPPTRIRTAVNDYVAAALMITNVSDRALDLRVRMTEGEKPPPWPTQTSWTALRTAHMVSPEDEPAAQYPSLLAPLDESQTVHVGAGETLQLWIDVDTYGMTPGRYQATLELTPYQSVQAQRIPVELQVLDVELPEECPAEVFCWGLNPLRSLGETPDMSQEQINALQDPWLQDMTRHGINRMLQTSQSLNPTFTDDNALAKPIDFRLHDAYLASKRRYVDAFVGGYSVAHYNMPGLDADPDVFAARFETLLRAWIPHLRTRGLTPDTFPLELIDEPSGAKLVRNRLAHQVLKRVAPDWKTIAAVSMDTPAGLQSLVPLLDIMVVNPNLNEACDKALRESGREIWTYVCEGSLETLHPYRYYRLLPWKTWSKGYTGFGFFWNMRDLDSPRKNRYSPFYYGRHGPVPSRGWQAFRRGTRDWAYLHALQQMVDQARDTGRDELTARAQKTMDQAVEAVLANQHDETAAETWRDNLLDTILAAQKDLAAQ